MSYDSKGILKAAEYQAKTQGYVDGHILAVMNNWTRESVFNLLEQNGFVRTGIAAQFKKKEKE